MPTIKARDNQQIHHRVFGRGQPVVMLHGVGMDSRHWLPFILPLATRFRFYLPDFRGAGKAQTIPVNQPDLFNNLKEDVEDMVNYHQLNDYLLVGYSLGASISMKLNEEGRFQKVKRYLNIDQSPCVLNQPNWTHGLLGNKQAKFTNQLSRLHDLLSVYPMGSFISHIPRQQLPEIALLLSDVMATAAGNQALAIALRNAARSPWLFSKLTGKATVHNIRAYLQNYFANESDFRESLTTCSTPITMFIGKRSLLYPYEGQQLIAHSLSHCQTVVFEKSGHVPQVDEPLKFARELARFLLRS